MTPGPRARYEADLARAGFLADAAQARAVERLEALYRRVAPSTSTGLTPPVRSSASTDRRWLGRWLRPGSAASAAGLPIATPRGLYLWGGVGRGKTYLMDCFHESLPGPYRMRLHFHRFMREVHRERRALGEVARPLERIAGHIAERAAVLCLDEFHVGDITDAMILGGLLEALCARGVTLVTTANERPADLYRGGLQRERFLPAIALLERCCEVLNVDGGQDYRLRALEREALYLHPLGPATDAALERLFGELAGGGGASGGAFSVDDRELPLVRSGGGVAWFTFADLFQAACGAVDYIEVARCFHTVIVSGLPTLTAGMDDPARRFITAVDEFYDRGVKLILAAECPLTALQPSGRLAFAFERTRSRLREMQTHAYLERPHAPD
jgi:cell division protein ZapE